MQIHTSGGESHRNFITIVSGLPRSGTSMMMKMLDAGNMPVLTDNIRTPDIDNPKGYYEFEPVKHMEHDTSFLAEGRGKAVKIVSPLLKYLDARYSYKIIFMLRNLDEILASQRKMSNRLAIRYDTIEDDILKNDYSIHLEEINKWQQQQKNLDMLYINYSDVISDPESTAVKVRTFLDIALDIHNMVTVIDHSLYRHRSVSPAESGSATAQENEEDVIIERLQSLGYL